MFAGVTVPQTGLSGGETLAGAVGLGAADSLKNERRVHRKSLGNDIGAETRHRLLLLLLLLLLSLCHFVTRFEAQFDVLQGSVGNHGLARFRAEIFGLKCAAILQGVREQFVVSGDQTELSDVFLDNFAQSRTRLSENFVKFW